MAAAAEADADAEVEAVAVEPPDASPAEEIALHATMSSTGAEDEELLDSLLSDVRRVGVY